MRVLLVLITLLCPVAQAADFALHSARRGAYSLDLTGEIRPGDAERLALVFGGKKRFPVTIRIDTAGGSLEEAMKLGNLLRQAHLSVIAADSCDLQCFVVLVGGVSRAITSDLSLSPPVESVDQLPGYLKEMGVPDNLVTELAQAGDNVTISLTRFAEEIGESPEILEEVILGRCGQFTPEELEDFRSLQAYRFLESLKLLEARTGRKEELSPVIAKYEVMAEGAAELGFEYQQQLLVQWQEISDCRKQVLNDAQDEAYEQVVAQARRM